ncbi:hypothetical protein D3C76_1060830 [compost metagenome]
MATDQKLSFFSEDELEYDSEWFGSGCRCPDAYLEQFKNMDTRLLQQPYYRNEDTDFVKWAVTYMTPQYTIGWFKHEIMWNQTRGMVAYFKNNEQATYLQMRCLHDGYDYCSGILDVEGIRDHLLLGVQFLTNGGDTHPSLDRIQGRIEASDFRLRMEFGGVLEDVSIVAKGRTAQVIINGLPLRFECLYAAFEEAPVVGSKEQRHWSWEVTNQGESIGLDMVIYAGQRKTIDFLALNKAAFLFSLACGQLVEEMPQIKIVEEVAYVRAQATTHTDANSHELTIPLQPHSRHPI